MDTPSMQHVFDLSRWPIAIARMPRFSEFRMDVWLAGFDDMLSRQEPFVIVLDLAAFLEDPREDPAEKRKGAIWLKSRRAEYVRLCRGNVYVVADPTARATVLAEVSKEGRKFGIRFEAAGDEASAIEIARSLLTNETGPAS